MRLHIDYFLSFNRLFWFIFKSFMILFHNCWKKWTISFTFKLIRQCSSMNLIAIYLPSRYSLWWTRMKPIPQSPCEVKKEIRNWRCGKTHERAHKYTEIDDDITSISVKIPPPDLNKPRSKVSSINFQLQIYPFRFIILIPNTSIEKGVELDCHWVEFDDVRYHIQV